MGKSFVLFPLWVIGFCASYSIWIPDGANGTPVAVQHQVKKPVACYRWCAYLRMAGMCPVSAVSTLQATPNAHITVGSPSHAVAVMQHPTPSVTNSVDWASMNMPHVDADDHVNNALVNGVTAVSPRVYFLHVSITLVIYAKHDVVNYYSRIDDATAHDLRGDVIELEMCLNQLLVYNTTIC